MKILYLTGGDSAARPVIANLQTNGFRLCLCRDLNYLLARLREYPRSLILLGGQGAWETAKKIRTRYQDKPCVPDIICLGVVQEDDEARRLWYLPPGYQPFQATTLVQRVCKRNARNGCAGVIHHRSEHNLHFC